MIELVLVLTALRRIYNNINPLIYTRRDMVERQTVHSYSPIEMKMTKMMMNWKNTPGAMLLGCVSS